MKTHFIILLILFGIVFKANAVAKECDFNLGGDPYQSMSAYFWSNTDDCCSATSGAALVSHRRLVFIDWSSGYPIGLYETEYNYVNIADVQSLVCPPAPNYA